MARTGTLVAAGIVGVAALFGAASVVGTSPDAEGGPAAAGFVLVSFLAVVIVAVWSNIALMWKRANDAELGPAFRYGYIFCSTIGLLIPLVNVLAWTAQAVMWWTLVLKRGVGERPYIRVDVFGDAPAYTPAGPGVGPATGLAALNSEDALRRRAAELAAAAKPAPAAPARSGAAPRGGFGGRTQPAFGKR